MTRSMKNSEHNDRLWTNDKEDPVREAVGQRTTNFRAPAQTTELSRTASYSEQHGLDLSKKIAAGDAFRPIIPGGRIANVALCERGEEKATFTSAAVVRSAL